MENLTPTEVLVLHARLIQRTGSGEEPYPDLHGEAAALMHAVVGHHPFVDGNKRTALTATGIFIELNGGSFQASNGEAAELVLCGIVEKRSVSEVSLWLREHCNLNE